MKPLAIFILLTILTSLVFAEYKFLNQPPILLNNPFYSFYQSIIGLTLKLPISAFTRANVLVKSMEESLYNVGFALETKKDTKNPIIDFRKYGLLLKDLLRRWTYFTQEESVKNSVKDVQKSLFRFMLALKYEPFTNLSENDLLSLKEIIQSLSDESYNLLGAKETFNNLQNLEISSEELIYLAQNLFMDKPDVLQNFASLINLKFFEAAKKENGLVQNIQELKKLIEKFMPEGKLKQISLEIIVSLEKLNEMLKLMDEGKVYIEDTETFQKLLETYQTKLDKAKSLILKQDPETLSALQEIKNLTNEILGLFINAEEKPAIKPELLKNTTSTQ